MGTSLSANQVRVGSATVAAHQTSVGCDSLHLLYQVRLLEVIKLTIRDVLLTPFGLLGAMAKTPRCNDTFVDDEMFGFWLDCLHPSNILQD